MRHFFFFTAVLSLIVSCSLENDHPTTPVSSFNIQKHGLKNRAPVEVIFTSGGPYEAEPETWYQYLCLEKETGDTFRVLSAVLLEPGFVTTDNMEYISCFSTDSTDFFILASLEENGTEKLTAKIRRNNHYKPPKPKIKLPAQVYSDPDYAELEARPFPTVFGIFVQAGKNDSP